jgi:hypothetical protein
MDFFGLFLCATFVSSSLSGKAFFLATKTRRNTKFGLNFIQRRLIYNMKFLY